KYAKPHSAEWLARQIKDQKEERAKALVRNWASPQCYPHIMTDTINLLKQHDEDYIVEQLNVIKDFSSLPPSHQRKLSLQCQLSTIDDHQTHVIPVLIYSGCTDSIIDEAFVRQHNISTRPLPTCVIVSNADGTKNRTGPLTEYVTLRLTVAGRTELMDFLVTGQRETRILLGHDWLQRTNPDINWQTNTITY
ncbi:hypothetical protein SERLA73DRAFT_41794, partial [Serpula lacrymans var. lacrymans S7.3]